jgi:hypothetical protein
LSGPISSREAWERIAGLIHSGDTAAEEAIARKPLLDWLQFSCTINEDDGIPPTHSENPMYPYPSYATLTKHHAELLKADLPGWHT